MKTLRKEFESEKRKLEEEHLKKIKELEAEIEKLRRSMNDGNEGFNKRLAEMQKEHEAVYIIAPNKRNNGIECGQDERSLCTEHVTVEGDICLGDKEDSKGA